MAVHISLPEILAGCSCALFISGEYLVGSVFLALSVTAGISRAAIRLQEAKTQQENFDRVVQMVARVGNYVEEFLNGVVFVSTHQQNTDDDDDDDTSNYN